MQGAIVTLSNQPKEITMHDKIKLIREALNAAQDAELKLSGAAIVELEAVNKYLFELEENLSEVSSSCQHALLTIDIKNAEIEELECEIVQLGRVAHG
jgi:hypothetical protein